MNLDCLLEPKSIAVVGASDEKDSVGYGIMASLLKGSVFPSKYAKPFKGKVFAVNPHHTKIMGLKAYASVLGVKEKIGLAVIAVPAQIVPQVLRECGEKKIPAAIVISSGFGETGNKSLETQVERTARENDIALLGPNTVGLMVPGVFNASFALSVPKAGNVAFVSQSGALADSVIDWALEDLFPFRAIVGLGNKTVLDESDFTRHFADDDKTKVIALYLEGVKDGRKFLQSLRYARAKGKTVVVLKGGVGRKGVEAAQTHTASLAGDDSVFEGALKQAKAKRAYSLEELFELSKALSMQPRAKKNAIAIITNGGGAGVLCADACEKHGVKLAELDPLTISKLNPFMHKAWSRANPVDLIGDALPQRYEKALEVLLSDRNVGGAIVIQTLQTMTKPEEDARVVVRMARKFEKPVVSVFMGGLYTKKSIRILHENSIPNYNDPVKAAKAMSRLVE
ncbi:MAG: CoA-binding protein [Candidatus Norongarragalinales archaeon]